MDDPLPLVGSELLGGARLPPPADWARYVAGVSVVVKVRTLQAVARLFRSLFLVSNSPATLITVCGNGRRAAWS